MISKRHYVCVRNLRNYKGADSDSDHCIVFTQFNLRMVMKCNIVKKTPIKKYKIRKSENPKIIIVENYIKIFRLSIPRS